jgi:hypothetical protein
MLHDMRDVVIVDERLCRGQPLFELLVFGRDNLRLAVVEVSEGLEVARLHDLEEVLRVRDQPGFQHALRDLNAACQCPQVRVAAHNCDPIQSLNRLYRIAFNKSP